MKAEKIPHFCPDWDFMHIKPGDPEMECCTCSQETLSVDDIEDWLERDGDFVLDESVLGLNESIKASRDENEPKEKEDVQD